MQQKTEPQDRGCHPRLCNLNPRVPPERVSNTHRSNPPRAGNARQATGPSQGDLAAQSGLTREYISKLENNHASPTLDTLPASARH
ncbi:MAG: helix-turn-helix transcriptional regulator [Planctomycetota bacterium]